MRFTSKDLNKTVILHPEETEKQRKWYIVDANWKTLWRLAVQIANKLIWKHKPYYTDSWDVGDFVVVKNAKYIHVTGKKLQDKTYYYHSGYKGSTRQLVLEQLLQKYPEHAVWYAVRGMLPKNKLRKYRMKRLKVFAKDTNKYDYLNPEQL